MNVFNTVMTSCNFCYIGNRTYWTSFISPSSKW